jgi:hypothetical protein
MDSAFRWVLDNIQSVHRNNMVKQGTDTDAAVGANRESSAVDFTISDFIRPVGQSPLAKDRLNVACELAIYRILWNYA